MAKSRLIGFLLLLVLPVLAVAGVVSAQTTRTGNTASVSKGEVIDSTLWTSGKTVNIAGEVNGDVFCAGQSVSITGTVHGDVICAAQSLNISGQVDGDIRVAAQSLNIGSKVTGNISAAAQTATLEAQSSARDVSIAGQDVTASGTVSRDLSLAGQSVTVNGSVGRDIKARLENLSITGGAKVGGTVDYTSANTAQIANSAKIGGKVTRTEPPKTTHHARMGAGFKFFAEFAMLVAAVVLVLLFPRTFHKVTNQAVNSWGKTLLTGFVASIVTPVLIFIVMVTIIGIPLALLSILAWILILALSGAFAAYYLGRLVWQKNQTNAIVIMLSGALILLILRFIPIIGFIVSLFAVWFGIGMILLELKRHIPKPRYNVKNLK